MDHAHADHAVRLPLRLAAEPYAKDLSDGAVALGLHCSGTQDVELAMLVDDHGIIAFCSSRLICRRELLSSIVGDSLDRNQIDSSSRWQSETLWLLVRSSTASNTLTWHHFEGQSDTAVPTKIAPRASSMTPAHDAFCARLITDSIRTYYAQQILEPSVRGFLSVLEKQFARGDLYLFELLQNAVDDGADTVRFAIQDNTLQVSHNGRRFTPLDVLGLSSVGLSTKSRQGKRTIGFMGVGFKAVYKRYARVCIRDGTYSFVYQEPNQNKSGYGWVMLPMWKQLEDGAGSGTMCHFSLEQPRGGMQSVLKDLSVLPVTAPPLLGRAALLKKEGSSTGGKWTLDWNSKLYVVERARIQLYTRDDRSEIVTVNITDGQGQERHYKWLFVSHKFMPSEAARSTYLHHTKRSHSGTEEVCGFVNLTTRSTKAGRVHSVLPTKISLPIPMHVQGSWLLSVDRQEVQDLSDNAWNLDILKSVPLVSANFFRWAANEKLEDYTALMPILPMPSPDNPDATEMLGQSISLRGLQRVLFSQRILPVAVPLGNDSMKAADNSTGTGYYEGQHSIWVPPSFLKWLSPELLRNWLGKRPLRTDLMGGAAYHPIFSSVHVLGQLCPLPERRSQLRNEMLEGPLRQPNAQTALRLMAAIGAAYDTHPDFITIGQHHDANGSKAGKSTSKNGTSNSAAAPAVACPALPALMRAWPVFLTADASLVTLDQIVLPAPDFALVPTDLAPILRAHLIKEETLQHRFGNGKKRGKMRGSGGQQKKSKASLQRLRPLLEEAIIKADQASAKADNNAGEEAEASTEDQHVASFLRRARSEMPSNVVDVPSAVSNLFHSINKQRGSLTEENLSTIMSISRYALETENSSLLSYVLVDDPNCSGPGAGMKLLPAGQAYVGGSIDEGGPGADLENFAGISLPFLSSKYSSMIQDSFARKKFVKLLLRAGVKAGLSVSASAVVDVERDRTTLQLILPKLAEGELPPVRKKVKCEVSLPYYLGTVMRKKYSLVDAELSTEWERLVRSMSADSAVGFIKLLLQLPVENSLRATPTNVPAAAKCLSGLSDATALVKDEGVSTNKLTVRLAADVAVPLRSRLYYLPPGQPGAKALDIAEARFVGQLKALKWLPCSLASSNSESTPLSLYRPEACLLDPDLNRPEMPVVHLPDPLLRRLKSSIIAQSLEWGRTAPPPPVTELVKLAHEAKCLNFDDSRRAEMYTEMVSIWTAIARAHLRGGLSPDDMRTIENLARDPSNLFIPLRRNLEARDKIGSIVCIDRCVRMPELINHTNNRDELKRLSVASLVASNFIGDYNRATDNPFYSSPEISKATMELMNIPALEDYKTDALIRASGSFVRYCFEVEPVISSRFSAVRETFSYAMRWCIESSTDFGRTDRGGLKVWCRRLGTGPKALRPRWVSPNGPVQVVLDDSKARSALLTPEMKIQTLGVLDHHDKEDCPNARTLSRIDKEVLIHCGILRLSDGRFKIKTRARGAGATIDGASWRVQLVCALLKSMEIDRVESSGDAIDQASSSEKNCFLAPNYEPLDVLRYESLTREFKAPSMNEPVLTPMYAVFGRAPKSQKKCVLVSGGPEDYSIELEELISGYVGVLSGPATQTKPYRAAIRLLSHLENEASFTKFVNRDFGDSDAAQRWRDITERNKTLDNLRKAELAKDAKKLRSLLITAEELCEDDPDGGDAVLQGARDLLAALEENEANLRRMKERKETLDNLRKAELAKDAKTLRSLLINAEALCEDDPDGGDMVLQPARDLLTSLENEAASNARGTENNALSCGRGRGVGRTLPSWMNSIDGPTAAPGVETSEAAVGPEPVTSGRGRGVSNQPAWMTSEKGVTVTAATFDSVKLEEEDAVVPSNLPPLMSNGDPPPVGRDPFCDNSTQEGDLSASVTSLARVDPKAGVGRGRGVSNLPAWMTNKGDPLGKSAEADPPSAPASLPTVGAGRDHGVSNLPACMTSSSYEPTDCNPELKAKDEITTKVGAGRGRGVSNLPAWMSSKDQPVIGPIGGGSIVSDAQANAAKRTLPKASFDNTDGRPTKKSRVSSSYNLNLSMDPDQEPDFLAWLKDKIDERTKLHGGSATISRIAGALD